MAKIVMNSHTIHNNTVKAIIKIRFFHPTPDCMESCGVKTVTAVWYSNLKTEQKSKNNNRVGQKKCPAFFLPKIRKNPICKR